MSKIRLTVKTCVAGAQPELLGLPTDASMEKFLDLAGERLGIKAQRAFLNTDELPEVKHVDILSQDDVVIVTEGEHPRDDKEEEIPLIRLAVLGAGGVGKSALTLRYVRDYFVTDWDPTIEDAYRTTVEVDGVRCKLEVLDTAGQDDFSALRPQWMMGKDGYIFVFGLDKEGSQHDLTQYYELHQQLREDSEPKTILLVGNKKDIIDEFPERRIMTVEEGKEMAEKWEAEYIETSAKTGHNIDELFHKFIRSVRKNSRKVNSTGFESFEGNTPKQTAGCCMIL